MGGPDILIVGGGPAGAIAGIVAARSGARVRILDRAVFPRDKLCGDTLNPGTLAVLRRLGVASTVEARGLRVDGMMVTGESGLTIVGRYPADLHGRAILRRELDALLLRAAADAGCDVEEGITVRRPLVDESREGRRVTGVSVAGRGGERAIPASVVIGADGRRSTVAFALGLARHPVRPRRWAVGAYFANVGGRTRVGPGSDPGPTPIAGLGVVGEMHVRRNCYIGVAPVPGGLTNVCVVRESSGGDPELRDTRAYLIRSLAADPLLAQRFENALLIAPPVVLGPLAVDAVGDPPNGLLLAGDAAGFIDPMTGDGLRFAIRGGELAAAAALRALDRGWDGVHRQLAAARVDSFAGKWRFNRALRALVASPRAIDVAAAGARLAPGILRAVIARAGDCNVAA